jgi:hypothetical protein
MSLSSTYPESSSSDVHPLGTPLIACAVCVDQMGSKVVDITSGEEVAEMSPSSVHPESPSLTDTDVGFRATFGAMSWEQTANKQSDISSGKAVETSHFLAYPGSSPPMDTGKVFNATPGVRTVHVEQTVLDKASSAEMSPSSAYPETSSFTETTSNCVDAEFGLAISACALKQMGTVVQAAEMSPSPRSPSLVNVASSDTDAEVGATLETSKVPISHSTSWRVLTDGCKLAMKRCGSFPTFPLQPIMALSDSKRSTHSIISVKYMDRITKDNEKGIKKRRHRVRRVFSSFASKILPCCFTKKSR